VEDGQLAEFGPGDHLVVARPTQALEVLLLALLAIRAPIEHDGAFVMNAHGRSCEDDQAGPIGVIPADQLALKSFA